MDVWVGSTEYNVYGRSICEFVSESQCYLIFSMARLAWVSSVLRVLGSFERMTSLWESPPTTENINSKF